MSKSGLKKQGTVLKNRTVGTMEQTGWIGLLKYRYCHTPNNIILHINFGRYKKGKKARDVDTRTIYDAITEKHKDYSDIWLDVQNKTAIGCEIHISRKVACENNSNHK